MRRPCVILPSTFKIMRWLPNRLSDSTFLGKWASHKKPRSKELNQGYETHAAFNDDKALWRSPWLRKATLVSFVTLFTGSWISLLVLWRYDINHNGFALTVSSSHYSWAYGPTVLLTIIISLWRQVDYYCKVTQPWNEMDSHATEASRSLLLDYISPLQIKSLYNATKNRHWAVTSSTLGFMILKIATLLSTVLLQPSPTLISKELPVVMNSQFNESAFWDFVVPYYERPDFDFRHRLAQNPSYVVSSTGPLYVYEAIVKSGLPYPNGTTRGDVFRSVEVPKMVDGITRLTALTTVFSSNISCETSFTTPRDEIRSDWASGLATIQTPTCSASSFKIAGWVKNELHPKRDPRYLIAHTFTTVDCSGNRTILNPRPKRASLNSSKMGAVRDIRLAIIMHNFTVPEHYPHSYTDPFLDYTIPLGATLTRTSATLCKVNYTLGNFPLARDLSQGTFSLDMSRRNGMTSKFNNLTGSELGEAMFSLLAQHYESFQTTNMFELMRASLQGSLPGSDYGPLMDPETQKSSATEVLGGLMAQMVQQFSIVPDATIANGTADVSETRLHIQISSLWAMVSAFIIMSILPLVILFSMKDGVSQNPTSVAAHAAILATSAKLQSLLKDTSTLRTSELTNWLGGHLFKTSIDTQGSFYIQPIGSAPLFNRTQEALARRKKRAPDRRSDIEIGPHDSTRISLMHPGDVKSKDGFWIPFTVQYPFITLALAFPILAIGGLEALYQVSERNQGLTDTNHDVRVYAGYLTSFIAFAISSTLNSVDFAFASFAPFTALCSRTKSYRRSTLINLVGEMPPWALYQACRNRQVGAALSIVSALIGSVLTVIASGLWVDQPRQLTAGLTMSSASTWHFQRLENISDYTSAANTLSMLHYYGGDQPLGTWDNLVFPTLNGIKINSKKWAASLGARCTDTDPIPCQYSLAVSALRPHLDCESGPPERFFIGESNSLGPEEFNPLTIKLPQHCRNIVPTYYIPWEGGVNENPDWIGTFSEVSIGPLTTNHSRINFNSSILGSNSGCPSIAVGFGGPLGPHLHKSDFSILACYQKVQRVNTVVNFTYQPQDKGLLGASNILQAPIIKEGDTEYLKNGVDGTETFFFSSLDPLVESLPNTGFTQVDGSTLKLDPVFSALVRGPNITALEELSGPNRTERLKSAVSEFYTKYMVLVMNSDSFRWRAQSGNSSIKQDEFNGTVTFEVSRLTVDSASKLTLQVMLATIVVLTALAFWLVELRGMLPRNPCSIASVMALLADSRMCSRDFMPPGSEWRDKDYLAQLFEGRNIKLGWWDRGGGHQVGEQRGCFGIDIGDPVSLGFMTRKGKKNGKQA
ncbi:hypothetical protein GGR51DRAFT_524521 [Nemania sp. FL0031]|nr:hypothetical protein GGR51DRAFT_524521 [Nemania sp. FL0031]